MSYTAENEAECRRILEALTSCVSSARCDFDESLDSDARSERVTQVDDRIWLLSDTFHKLTVNLKRERNFYVPINRVADDLLIYTWTYTDLSDRLAISRVSGRWRRLALSTSSLWGMINLEQNNIRCLRNLLERSGSSPLHMVCGIKRFSSITQTLYKNMSFVNGMTFDSFKYHNMRCKDDEGRYRSWKHLGLVGSDEGGTDFIRQCEFDAFVGRCATLDALVDDNQSHYITPKSPALTIPMPYLETLRLTQSNMSRNYHFGNDPRRLLDTSRGVTLKKLPCPLFSSTTPRLRELCFDYTHAHWDDPIYRNLTNLRVRKPLEKAKSYQILRILRSCPNLTDLELNGCLQPVPSFDTGNKTFKETTATLELGDHSVVSLPKLKYFSFLDCHEEAAMDFLGALSLPQLKRFYMNNSYHRDGVAESRRHRPCFIDQLDRPFPSLLPTISKPNFLRISAHPGHIFLEFQYILNESDRVRIGNWVHHGDNDSRVQRPKMNHLDDHQTTDEEYGLWSYTLHSVHPTLNGQSVNANDWTNVTYNIGLEPTPGTSPPYPTEFTHPKAMQPQLISISRQYIDLFDTLATGGVQFDKIRTLRFDGSTHFPDAYYRTIFGLCSGVRTLRMNYHKVGILAAIVKDDESMLPELEHIYMDIKESSGQIYGVNQVPAKVLANWVETRQRKALASLESTETPVGSLKTVLVKFYHRGHPETAIETRERIKSILGENGVFVWRLKESRDTKAQKRRMRAFKEDTKVPDSDKAEDHGEREEDDESGFEDEEPANDSRPFGWSAGPW